LSQLNLHRKTVIGHTYIIFYGNDDFGLQNHCHGWTHLTKQLQDISISYICYGNEDFRLHNHCHSWTHIKKWLQDIPISCVMVMTTSDYIIVVTVKLVLKNGCRDIHILRNYQIWLVWLPNRHCGWIDIKKLVLVVYHIYSIWMHFQNRSQVHI
jgi:recombinational DNA repair protein RecT